MTCSGRKVPYMIEGARMRALASCAYAPLRTGVQPRATFGEPMMLDRLRVCLLPVFGLLLASCLLISPRPAQAQFPEGENKWTEIDVTNAINRAIDESKESAELREKLVRRFSECSLMYG